MMTHLEQYDGQTGSRPSACILTRFEWHMIQSNAPLQGIRENLVIRALKRNGLQPPVDWNTVSVRRFGRRS